MRWYGQREGFGDFVDHGRVTVVDIMHKNGKQKRILFQTLTHPFPLLPPVVAS